MYEDKFKKGNYKAAFKAIAQELATRKMPLPWRLKAVGDLCEAYVAQIGEMPDSQALELLADYILADDLCNRCPDKVTNNEYPFLSDGQTKLRNKRELPKPDLNYYSNGKTFKKRVAQKHRGWARCKDM